MLLPGGKGVLGLKFLSGQKNIICGPDSNDTTTTDTAESIGIFDSKI